MNTLIKKITLLSSIMFVSVLAAFSSIAQAETFDTSNPYQLVDQISVKLFDRMKNDQATIKADPNHLKTIVEQELMPYVNDQYAALKVLGPNLKGADKAEVKVFLGEFREYLITTYAQALAQYKDQVIKIEQEKAVPSDRRIVKVNVDIIDPKAPTINLQFTLLKNKSTHQWKAYDMTVEGVSLLSTKQAEWNAPIRQKGLPFVTQSIEEMARKSIVLGESTK